MNIKWDHARRIGCTGHYFPFKPWNTILIVCTRLLCWWKRNFRLETWNSYHSPNRSSLLSFGQGLKLQRGLNFPSPSEMLQPHYVGEVIIWSGVPVFVFPHPMFSASNIFIDTPFHIISQHSGLKKWLTQVSLIYSNVLRFNHQY